MKMTTRGIILVILNILVIAAAFMTNFLTSILLGKTTEFTNMKARAIRNGVRITEIEKALGMFVEESIQQWALSGENPEKVTSRIKFWNDYYAFAHPAVCITTLLFLGFAFGVAYYRQQQRIRQKIWEQGRIETQIGIEMEVDNVQVMEMVEEGNDAFVIKSPRSRRNDSGMTNSKLLEQEEFYDDHQEKEEGQLFNGINILNGNQNTYRYRQLDEPTSPELERGSLYGNRNQRVENFKDIEIGKLFSVKNALNRYRYYVSVFVLAEFLSVLGFILIPTMPPRLLSECDAMNLDGIGLGGCIYTLGKMVIGDGEGMMEISGNVPMFGFIDTIDKYGSRFFSWKDQTVQALNNPYAAMPSQHTMVALWVAMVCHSLVDAIFRAQSKSFSTRMLGFNRNGGSISKYMATVIGGMLRLRIVAIALVYLYPIATVYCIVITGNHYILDAVAGIVLLAISSTVVTYCF